jgi:glycosyltransferase involved in cell wall biosynthesis
MKILFISGREPAYVRNALILNALRRDGIEILDCSDPSSSYPARYFKVLTKFIRRRKEDFDFVFIGFWGQPLVPLIRKLTDKPIIFDAFLSGYDTMCFDRKTFNPDSPAGRFFYWLDKRSCEIAGKVLLDTNAHIDYFADTFGLQKNKFQRIFVGADDSLFYPREAKREDHRFRVFYYSTCLSLHGTEYIIQAAGKLARQREIEFKVVGKGPQLNKIRKLARSLGVENITFVDWIPYEKLPLEIAQADICLGGHFSNSGKAGRVIAGKTFQFIAMKRPVIVGDCPGNRELFTHKKNAYLVKMADADSLAGAILELRDNDSLREQIAQGGYETFVEKCNTDVIRRTLKSVIDSFYRDSGSEPENSL